MADCWANADENTAFKDAENSIDGGIDLTIVYANEMPRDNGERTEFRKLACSRKKKKTNSALPHTNAGLQDWLKTLS